MDFDSSTKFISSLAKFLQSLCNGYVEFDNGVEVIGHIYLSVDTGKKIDYILNEKVCKTNENSVTFISNSFHAQPAEKPKPTPKPSKPVEQDKPSDPGGSQDDEILILDDQDSKPSDTSFDNVNQQQSTPSKSVPPQSASKRSYQQSFHQKSRPAKHSRPNPPSIHNPNGAHETDSLHSDNNSSSSFLASQALPSDSNIATASEADMSHLSQVFPQTSMDSTNNPNTSVQDIKQEPGGGDYNVNVKQEFDTSAQGDEDPGMYDDQDQSGYGGMYGDEYYGGARGDGSHRHVDYSQMSGAGQEYYPGGSGEGAGGDSSDIWRYKYQCDICQKRLRSAWELRDHKNSVHFKVLAFPCSFCGKRFAYKRSLKRHVESTCGKIQGMVQKSFSGT